MPTIKEISIKIGVSPQTVRRFVKSEFQIEPQARKAIVLTDEQASIVANHFADVAKHVSDKKTVLPDNNDRVSELLQQVATLEIAVATYKERVAGLERERDLLKEQLDAMHEALEREQMQSKGFWSRLGQKLLPRAKKEDEK